MDDPLLAFLKALRERAGLTQIELSYRAGLSETYYGKIESGERRASPRVILFLLRALAATTLEEQQAIRLFAESRLPSEFLERLAPRPQPGTVMAPVAAPSRKRRRRLGLVLLVSGSYLAGAPGMVAMASARPIACADDQRDSVAWRRRRAA